MLALADWLIMLPQATDYDKREIDKVKLMLKGKGAKSIEKELYDGTYSRSTLDRIEKLYKDRLILEQNFKRNELDMVTRNGISLHIGKTILSEVEHV